MLEQAANDDVVSNEAGSYAPHITVSKGMSGWYAVKMHFDGFWEPWSTGFGRYIFKDHAIKEAREWAEAEGLEYRE